jgi:hypothetical protein
MWTCNLWSHPFHLPTSSHARPFAPTIVEAMRARFSIRYSHPGSGCHGSREECIRGFNFDRAVTPAVVIRVLSISSSSGLAIDDRTGALASTLRYGSSQVARVETVRRVSCPRNWTRDAASLSPAGQVSHPRNPGWSGTFKVNEPDIGRMSRSLESPCYRLRRLEQDIVLVLKSQPRTHARVVDIQVDPRLVVAPQDQRRRIHGLYTTIQSNR